MSSEHSNPSATYAWMKPVPYKKAPDNESSESVSLVPLSGKDNKHNAMDRFRRYEEVIHINTLVFTITIFRTS